MSDKIIYSGIFFPLSAKTSPLHVTYDYRLDASVLPPNVEEGQFADVFIYGMCCNEQMNALACYTHIGKDTLRHQARNSDIPLHITLTNGVDKAPVEAGIILRKYMLEASEAVPNMDGYLKFNQLIKWTGKWGYMTVSP